MKAKKFKTYDLSTSPFFQLSTKKKLAEILGITLSELKEFCKDSNYNEWIDYQGGKPRPIQSPNKELKKLHSRVGKILSRVATPAWVFSGKKGSSYVDNSTLHLSNPCMLNVDIRKFYPSSQREFVYRCFKNIFRMADDVASIFADFVTFNNHIPTGSPASQVIAYWAFKPTFDRIESIALSKNLAISLYVDDLTFSGKNPIPRSFLFLVRKELKKVGHSIKSDKVIFAGKNDYKKVTGVYISPSGERKVPNQLRHEIVQELKKFSYDNLSRHQAESLLGKIVSGRQIEPTFMEISYKRLVKIMKDFRMRDKA